MGRKTVLPDRPLTGKEKAERYRKKHPERKKASNARRCKVKSLEDGYKRIQEFPERYLLKLAKRRAKNKNIPFSITEEDVVIPDRCPVLGIKLRQLGVKEETDRRGRCPDSPSLDRIIPKLGYVKGNVIVISTRANNIKGDATLEELEKILNFYT